MSTVPFEVQECYKAADHKAMQKWPYVLGGGHPGFEASLGVFPQTQGVGYDCSGWASSILHAGRILNHPSGSLATHELEHWGFPGQGAHLTLWVHNSPGFEHCFLEFDLGDPAKRWSQAEHSGTICGWFPFMPTTGYTPRRHYA